MSTASADAAAVLRATRVGDAMTAELIAHRLPPEAPAETYSTPRRLTVRVARLAERQADLEELVTGPPVSAAFGADGSPTPAAAGFAATGACPNTLAASFARCG